MDQLERLRLFTRVAELESYTRAATALSLPKASVSQAVKDLETHLKLRLFNRTTRRVHLTVEGQTLLLEARELLLSYDRLLGRVQSQAQELRGRLRMDMSQGLAKLLVIPKLGSFTAQYPSLRIELSSTDRLVDVIGEAFDCVVRVGERVDSGLVGKRLGEMRIANCASPAYLKRMGRPKSLKDLEGHHLIEFAWRLGAPPEGFEYRHKGRYRTLPLDAPLTVNSSEAYVAACAAGLGIIQSPRIGVEAFLKSGELVEILPDLESKPMPVTLLYPHRQFTPPRVQILIDWLTDVISARLKAEDA